MASNRSRRLSESENCRKQLKTQNLRQRRKNTQKRKIGKKIILSKKKRIAKKLFKNPVFFKKVHRNHQKNSLYENYLTFYFFHVLLAHLHKIQWMP